MVCEKRKGTPNRVISETLKISVRWIQKITKRYEGVKLDQIVYPMKLGRPKTGMPGRMEHSVILSSLSEECSGAVS